MIPNTDKDIEKSDHLCIADGNAKGTVILEKFVIKLNNTLTMCPSNHSLLHLSQTDERSRSHTNIHKGDSQ